LPGLETREGIPGMGSARPVRGRMRSRGRISMPWVRVLFRSRRCGWIRRATPPWGRRRVGCPGPA